MQDMFMLSTKPSKVAPGVELKICSIKWKTEGWTHSNNLIFSYTVVWALNHRRPWSFSSGKLVRSGFALGIHATQTQTDTHTHAQVALCSLPTLSSLTLTVSDLVRASAEENPCPWQIFDDVIFARLETEADVDICVTVCLLSSRPLLPFPSLPLLSHLPSKLVK